MKKRYWSLVLLPFLGACAGSSSDNPRQTSNMDTTISLSASRSLPAPDTSLEQELAPATKEIRLDTSDIPEEPAGKIKILQVGAFHKDEVWKGAEKKEWYGLFKGQSGYYLKRTPIAIHTVYDPISDDDYTWSGREVKAETQEETILLVTGIALPQGHVDTAQLRQHTLWPGESAAINFAGVTYQLSATGNKTKVGDNWYEVKNYQLFVSVVKGGREVKQLLAEADEFDDTMMHLIWVGDLDGDKQLDFIIDLSQHYNQELPTLFLSSEASANEVVKKVAELSMVGC